MQKNPSPKPAFGSAKICFWKNSKARKLLKLRLLPEGDLIPVNTSGISYFCFLFLFSFYSFKFEKLDQRKLNSHTEVFYNIGGQSITCRSNVACHINSVKCLFPDTLSFPGMSQIWARNKLWAVQIILMVCPFFWRAHHKAQAYNSCTFKISFQVIRNKTCSTVFRCHPRFGGFVVAERLDSVS